MISVTNIASSFEGTQYKQYPGSTYSTHVHFDIYRNGQYFDSGMVEYITDFKWGQTYTTTYVNRGLFEELFIAPKALNQTSGEVSVYVRTVPFITFIWIGLGLMVTGMTGLIATGRTTNNTLSNKSDAKKRSEKSRRNDK